MICSESRVKMEKRKTNEIAAITSSELSGLIYSPLASEISRPFSRQIFLAEVYVAGCNYIRNIKKYLSQMKVGDRVILLREPKNKYDELAILVKDERKHKLGYVPSVRNEVMSRLMDAGKLLYGTVTKILDPDDERYPWNALFIAIYMED